MMINLFLKFSINLFIQKLPYDLTRVYPTMFVQTAVARRDFNVEMLVTSHLKANKPLYMSHSFTSRQFALFMYCNCGLLGTFFQLSQL